jgi:anti-sigma factor RsiW
MIFGNTKCRRAQAQFDAYVDGELKDRAWLESHVAACQDCRSRLEQVQAMALGLDGLVRQTPPEGFAERVIAAVSEQRTQVAYRPPRFRPAFGLAFAATTTLLIFAFFSFRMLTRPAQVTPEPTTAASVTAQELRADAAEYESRGNIAEALHAYHQADELENTASLDTARAYEKAGFAGEAAYRYAEIAFY